MAGQDVRPKTPNLQFSRCLIPRFDGVILTQFAEQFARTWLWHLTNFAPITIQHALLYQAFLDVLNLYHMSLYLRTNNSKESVFFLRSNIVQKGINNYTKPGLLVRDMTNYMIGNSEARVALAFNGATPTRNGNKINVAHPIRYPRYAMAESLPFIKVQEGLFWALQKRVGITLGL